MDGRINRRITTALIITAQFAAIWSVKNRWYRKRNVQRFQLLNYRVRTWLYIAISFLFRRRFHC